MVVGHVAVEEVVVVPSYNTRVRANPLKTAVDVLGVTESKALRMSRKTAKQ